MIVDFTYLRLFPYELHSAAKEGNLELATLLIQKGYNLHRQNFSGKSPLYYAAKHGHVKIVEILIERGADINQKGLNGKTPLSVATDEVKNTLGLMAFCWIERGNFERGYKIFQTLKENPSVASTYLEKAIRLLMDRCDYVRPLLLAPGLLDDKKTGFLIEFEREWRAFQREQKCFPNLRETALKLEKFSSSDESLFKKLEKCPDFETLLRLANEEAEVATKKTLYEILRWMHSCIPWPSLL